MMKKVKYSCPKCENRVALLGIFGLKIALLALKVIYWQYWLGQEINLNGADLLVKQLEVPSL